MKEQYSIIFVVLVYRNTSDLLDFFKSNHIGDSHTIVVNSYYDEETEAKFKSIALQYHADFLSVPNKGYGFGNNRGIEFALSHYKFRYLIISNADIEIENFNINDLQQYNESIIAPRIVSLDGKEQNPCAPYGPIKMEAFLRNVVYKNRHTNLIWLFFIWSRLKKELFHIIYPLQKRIFAAHGAFVIIPYNIINKLVPLYNERMFLFNEEAHLGKLAKKNGIATIYVPSIVIRHKEDGSMKVASVDVFEMERLSYIEYYNKWFKNG